jgi:uncharacterized membrane protein
MTAGKSPINHSQRKRNQLLLISVCIVGIMIASSWYAFTPQGFLNKLDAVGYAVCHRIPSHSFTVNGRPLPLCARCSGMYLGALLGMLVQYFTGERHGGFSRKWLIVLCSLGVFFIIDGLNSFLAIFLDAAPLYPPQNWIRLLTGWSVGLLIAALIYPIFSQTVWQDWDPKAILDRKVPTLILVSGSLLIIAGALSGVVAILYPLAILSVVGVVLILTMIYIILMLMFFKQEKRYNHFNELALVLSGGLILTLIQIGLFDLVRYLLTETWSGLPLL